MTEAGVKTCRIPGAILYHPELTLPEKVVLGLVYTFKDGLRLSNAEIGKILCLYPDNVSRIISKLESAGWIRITGKQSRWRRLYFVADNKVKQDDTLSFETDTLSLATAYFVADDKQNIKVNIEEENFSFSSEENETPPETKPTPETPDPERVQRVLQSLGLAI